jgi:hypothetical protein
MESAIGIETPDLLITKRSTDRVHSEFGPISLQIAEGFAKENANPQLSGTQRGRAISRRPEWKMRIAGA